MASTVQFSLRKEKDVNDPSTYWLNIMNIALGVVVLLCCLAVAYGVMQEVVARRKRRAAVAGLDREVADLVHTFQTPELGLTMADGGEPIEKREKR
jgi:hypothetical protein